MPKITSHSITQGEFIYELALDLKDAAIMENRVQIDVIATRRPINETAGQEVAVALYLDFEEMVAKVVFEDQVIGQINLAKLDLPDDAPGEILWQEVCRVWDGSPLEEMIQMIPADPVFGCLLKAGISTTVGQAIRCYHQARGDSLHERIRQTLVCLADNSVRMILTASVRTLRCMVLLGLG